MFDRGIRTRDEQRKRVMGEGWDTEDARTNFRTGVIRTLRDKLSELLGNKGDALPPSGPDGQPYKLAPRIKVIGVVHIDTYKNPPRYEPRKK